MIIQFNPVFIVMALVAIIYIFLAVRKGRLSINDSLFWAIGSALLLVLALDPKIIDKIASFSGVDYPPSLLFAGSIVFLVLVNVGLSKKVAEQQEKIVRLGQDVAIIKESRKKK